MIFQCTGGGILVPIFLNAIPVPLSNDAYPIAILLSFWLHNYVPILRDVVALSPIVKVVLIVLYESLRAAVVVKFTALAGTTIPPSDFGSVAVFGPIFCGTIAGCGGAFLPLNKGLDPIKDNGLAQPMLSAGMAATFYHIVTHCLPRWFPSLLLGVLRLDKKAHVLVAVFFVAYHWSTAFPTLKASPSKKTTTLGTTTTTGQESNSSAAMVTPSRPTTRGAGKRR